MQNTPWQPTWKWHLKWFAALAGVCILALVALKYARNYLPEQYQPKTPAPETTPWRAR